jgi:murein DD-endopeptidase MepM/ murein hydrolase activator NlpD
VKLDYKSYDIEMGSFQRRHLVRIILGCIAVLCLSLTFIKPPVPTSSLNELAKASIEQAQANAETKDSAQTILSENSNSSAGKSAATKPIIIASSSKDKMAKAQKEEAAQVQAKAEEQTKEAYQSSTEVKSNAETKTEIKAEATAEKLSSEKPVEKPANLVWETVKVQKGDTLAKIFKRQGYTAKDLTAIMNADPNSKKKLIALKNGQEIRVQADDKKQVQALALDMSKDEILQISKIEDKFNVEYKQQPFEKQIAFGKGKVNSSLSLAGRRAGLDQNIISQMVEIFGWNIDFSSDLQPNDTFRVLFEEKRLEGEKVGSGNILAAEIVTKGKSHKAIRYTDKNGHTGYFSPEGQGLRQAFLRYPIEFTRISSGFGSRRHPIIHKMRKHTGVDLAAPRGTPVKAAGDGKVIFVGTRGGYGKVVELQHGAQYSTLYGHLSKFAPKLKAGCNVKQGDIIGNVGRTGLATGDHLHYEFRVAGIHRDPLTINLPRRNPISDASKHQFLAHAKEMMRLMDDHENKVNVVKNDYLENKD